MLEAEIFGVSNNQIYSVPNTLRVLHPEDSDRSQRVESHKEMPGIGQTWIEENLPIKSRHCCSWSRLSEQTLF